VTTKKDTKKGVKRKYYPFNHEDRLEVKDNKCVLIVQYEMPEEVSDKFPMISLAHLCGYVALPLKDIPPALLSRSSDNYLDWINVPGGITYAQVVINNRELQQVAYDSFERKVNNYRQSMPDSPSQKQFEVYMDAKKQYEIEYTKDLLDLGADTVVYGFDTSHAGNDNKENYQSVDFIMKCCEQMEQQLLELISRYKEIEAADPEDRLAIIEDIRSHGVIATEPSPMVYFMSADKFKKNTDDNE
jgi:hypothetical protein